MAITVKSDFKMRFDAQLIEWAEENPEQWWDNTKKILIKLSRNEAYWMFAKSFELSEVVY